jgi:O-antigen/teichoic acid export membrane protein
MIKKILNNSFWLLLANSAGRLSMFIANIFAARLLTQDMFGQFMMARNSISILENIISGTMGTVVTKNISHAKQKKHQDLILQLLTIFFLYTIILSFLSIIIYLYAPLIVNNFFLNSTILLKALYIGILILVFSSLSTLAQSILIGMESFKKLSTISILSSSISIPIILLLIINYNFYGSLIGILFYFSLDSFLKYLYIKKNISIKNYLFSFKYLIIESKKYITVSFPLLFAIILNSTTFWYARVILINYSSDFKEIAIFDAAFQWLTIIMIITGATTSVIIPMLSKTILKKDNKLMNKIFFLNLSINIIISITIASIFILFSDNIMHLYGETYIQGKSTLISLSISSIFFSISSIFNKYIISTNYSIFVLFNSLISSSALLIYLTNLKYLNAYNLATSFLIYYITSSIIYYISFIYIKNRKLNA